MDFINESTDPAFRPLFEDGGNASYNEPSLAESVSAIFKTVSSGKPYIEEFELGNLVRAIAVCTNDGVLDEAAALIIDAMTAQNAVNISEELVVEMVQDGRLNSLVDPPETIETILADVDNASLDGVATRLRSLSTKVATFGSSQPGSGSSSGYSVDSDYNQVFSDTETPMFMARSANVWNRVRSLRKPKRPRGKSADIDDTRAAHSKNPRSLRRKRTSAGTTLMGIEETFETEVDSSIQAEQIFNRYTSMKLRRAGSVDPKRVYLKHIFMLASGNHSLMRIDSFSKLLRIDAIVSNVPNFKSTQLVNAIFDGLDTGRNGSISHDEFYDAFHTMINDKGMSVRSETEDFFNACYTAMVDEIDRIHDEAQRDSERSAQLLLHEQHSGIEKDDALRATEEHDQNQAVAHAGELAALQAQLDGAKAKIAQHDRNMIQRRQSTMDNSCEGCLDLGIEVSDLKTELKETVVYLNDASAELTALKSSAGVKAQRQAILEEDYARLQAELSEMGDTIKRQNAQLQAREALIAQLRQDQADAEDLWRGERGQFDRRAGSLQEKVDSLRVQLRLTEAASTDNGQAVLEREALERTLTEAAEAATLSQARLADLESELRLRLDVDGGLEANLLVEQSTFALLRDEIAALVSKLETAAVTASLFEAVDAKLQAELAETARLNRLVEAQDSLDRGLAGQLAAGVDAGDGRDSVVLDELNAALRGVRELAQFEIDLKVQLAAAQRESERVPSLVSRVNLLEQQVALDNEQLGHYQDLIAEHGKTSSALVAALAQTSTLDKALATTTQDLEQLTGQSERAAAAFKTELDDALDAILKLENTGEKLRAEAEAARQRRDAEIEKVAGARLKNVADKARLDKIIKSQGNDVASMMKDVSQANKQTKRMQVLVDEKTVAISKLQKKYSDIEAALATLRDEHDTATELIAELEEIERELREALGENSERSRLSMSMQVAQVDQLKAVLEEEKARAPELEQMLRKESEVHQDIADVRAAKITELTSMLDELQGVSADLNSAKLRIATLKNSLDTTAMSKAQLENEVASLTAALEASKNFALAASARPMPDTFSAFEASLDEQIEANQIDIRWLKEYIVMKDQQTTAEVNIAQNEVKALKKAAKQANHESTAMQADLYEQVEASRSETKRLSSALKRHGKADDRLAEAHAQITKVTEALASVQAELAPAAVERDQLKRDLAAQSTALQSAKRDLASLRERLKKAAGTERKLQQSTARVDGLKVEIKYLKAEVERLKSALSAEEESSAVTAASVKEMRALRNELAHVQTELTDADETIARLRQHKYVLHAANAELADNIQVVTAQSRAIDLDASSDADNDIHRWGTSQFSWVGREIERAFASSESWLRSSSFGPTANSLPIYLIDSPFHSGQGEAALAVTPNVLRITPSCGEIEEWPLSAMTHYATKGGVVMLQLDDGALLSFRLLGHQ